VDYLFLFIDCLLSRDKMLARTAGLLIIKRHLDYLGKILLYVFKKRYIYNALFFLILIISLLLRIYKLGYRDFWLDEIASVKYAQYPWGNWNAPFYWILLHFWVKILGHSEFSVRFLSLIFSFFSVALVFLLGKKLFNKKTGIFSSTIMGLSSFQLWYAQEAREYSLVLFLGLLSSHIFLSVIRQGRWKYWWAFIVVSLVGLYTSYFYIIFFFSQGLYFLYYTKNKLNLKQAFLFLVIWLLFSPYLYNFFWKFFTVQQGFWIGQRDFNSILITLDNFVLGYNASYLLYFILAVFLAVIFILVIKRLVNSGNKDSLIFCIFFFLLPIFLVLFLSKAFFPIYIDRGLIVSSAYLYLILGLELSSLNRLTQITFSSILLVLLLISGYRYFADKIYTPHSFINGVCLKKPTKPLVHFITDNIMPSDTVVFSNYHALVPFKYYFSKHQQTYFLFDHAIPDPNWQRPVPDTKYNIPLHKINQLYFGRLWVVLSDWSRSGELDENSTAVREWLGRHFKLEITKELEGLLILRYVRQ
jgi:hypothetical protein